MRKIRVDEVYRIKDENTDEVLIVVGTCSENRDWIEFRTGEESVSVPKEAVNAIISALKNFEKV